MIELECYLDNAATTQALPEVADVVKDVMCNRYGNPSSLHNRGFEAEKIIRDARESIAKTLKCSPDNIIFTSGGTEGNNMALVGGALANQREGKHIITTCYEHASVYRPLMYLEDNMGFEVTYLPVDKNGRVELDALKDALREDTIIVSIMHVNNEIGSVNDIYEIGNIVKEYNKNIIYHVDAIQSYGKIMINAKRSKADFITVSGHKIHGPKGTGFVFKSDNVKVHPIIHGGGQQKNFRSGTENVPGIAGLKVAADFMCGNMSDHAEHFFKIKKMLKEKCESIEGVTVNACEELEATAPHVLSVSFEGVRSEVLLHALEDRGVFVSSGSACSSNHPGISHALQAIGVDKNLLESTIRFSFSVFTTAEMIDYTVEQIEDLLPMLRKYVKR